MSVRKWLMGTGSVGWQLNWGLVPMRVVIQQIVTNLYLKERNCWTPELSEAINFGFLEKAASFALEQQITDAQLVIAFMETGQTYVFPVYRPPGPS